MPDLLDRLKTALADSYAIEREIGAGGMATVYLARDLKHDRTVAVKVFRPELSAVLGRERFDQEIRISAGLQHPNILTLIDSGEADGLLYYVMPYVAGESLRDKMNREKQVRIEEALAIAGAVAKTLDYAHRHDVIHRDIKPENILLYEGQPVVADFGIAVAVTAAGGERLTETGISLGTPHYMSPEQATADSQLDGRSDIYALGAVLYEMLTGEPPHTGANSMAVIAKLMTDRPTRPRTLRDTITEELDEVVMKALAKVPADRYTTGAEFAEALKSPRGAKTAESTASTLVKTDALLLQDVPEAPPTSRMLMAVGVVGAVVFAFLFDPVFSEFVVPVDVSKAEARAAADAFLSEQGAVGSFKHQVRFVSNSTTRDYLQLGLGLEEARRWAREEVPTWEWSVEWYQPGEPENWRVWVASGSRITRFQHRIGDEQPGADLSEVEARAVAEEFLEARGWTLSELEPAGASRIERMNRGDHQLSWEKRGTSAPWSDDGDTFHAPVRVVVDVKGEAVEVYHHSLDRPDQFSRTRVEVDDTFIFVMAGVLILAIVVSVERTRAKAVPWLPTVAITAMMAIPLAIAVANYNNFSFGLGSAASQSTAERIVEAALSTLLFAALMGALVLPTAAAALSSARITIPQSLAGLRDLIAGRFVTPSVVRSAAAGYALAGVVIGLIAVARLGTLQFVGHEPMVGSELTAMMSRLAFLDRASLAVAIVVGVLMIVSVVKRFVRSSGIALLVMLGLAWVVSLPGLPMQPDLGRTDGAFALVIVGFLVLRYGAMATTLGIYVSLTVMIAADHFAMGNATATNAAIVLSVAALVPAVPIVLSRLPVRRSTVVPAN